MPENINKDKSYLYKLLISPRYSKWRYSLLFLALALLSFQEVIVNYEHIDNRLLFLYSAIVFFLYVFGVHLNVNIFFPRFLLKKRYVSYILALGTFVLLIVVMQFIIQSFAIQLPVGDDYNAPYISMGKFLDSLSLFIMVFICILGSAVYIILKHWMNESERIGELEKMRVESEVQLFKELVDPFFLSNVLQKSASLMETDRERASQMLYKLSEVLRYQLYDSVKKQVILAAEIKFTKQYLELVKIYQGSLEYSVHTETGRYKLQVAPLIFVPLIAAVIQYNDVDEHQFIDVSFKDQNKNLVFICLNGKRDLTYMDLNEIRHRLDLIYMDKYSISVSGNSITLKIEVG